MRKQCHQAMLTEAATIWVAAWRTQQAGGVGPGAHELQDAATAKAVPDGEDLVLLHQVKGADLHSATTSCHAVNSCRLVMRCEVLA